MKIRKLIVPLAALLASLATQALALPANAPLTVRLCTVSSTGTVTQVQEMHATSDTHGKMNFTFNGVPTSDSMPMLMVQVLDASNNVLRTGMVPAPVSNGSVQMGVSEVTHKQAKAMLGSLAQTGNTASTAAQWMNVHLMVRSGAMSDHDATSMGPIVAAAASAFETYMTGSGGASATQMAALRTAMFQHMREVAAGFQQAAQTTDGTPAGDQAASNLRADAMANFMDDMINAGADAGLSPSAMMAAFDHAGSAAQSISAAMDNPGVMSAMGSALRADSQVRQLMAQQREYGDAMTTMGAPADQMQQMKSASATLSVAMTHAQEHFEEMFASTADFPTDAQIQAAEAAMATAMDAAFQDYMTGTAASTTTVSGMLTTMASQMAGMSGGSGGMGGGAGGMTPQTLHNMGVGTMVPNPGATPEDWPVMMTSAANFMTSSVSMTYTPSTGALQALLTPQFAAPAAPDFSQFAGSYRAMMELQYDLMLAKFIDLQAMANAGVPVSEAMLAAMQDQDRTRRDQLMANVGGLTVGQRSAMVAAMAQPEMWNILSN